MRESMAVIIAATEQLEREILKERDSFEKGKKSSFSYWLYAFRVKRYWSEEKNQINGEMLKRRLEDIICQNYINMEDYPLDEVLHLRAEERIRKAKKWLEFL